MPLDAVIKERLSLPRAYASPAEVAPGRRCLDLLAQTVTGAV